MQARLVAAPAPALPKERDSVVPCQHLPPLPFLRAPVLPAGPRCGEGS